MNSGWNFMKFGKHVYYTSNFTTYNTNSTLPFIEFRDHHKYFAANYLMYKSNLNKVLIYIYIYIYINLDPN